MNSISYFSVIAILLVCQTRMVCAVESVLQAAEFAHHVEKFNSNDSEAVVNLIPNKKAWNWMQTNIPLFECPDETLEENYYFRWWTYRKHIKDTPNGLVLTEFIEPVNHAGPYNTIACAYGHHIAEGRWLRRQQLLDEYTLFWFRSGDGISPASHFHKFSSWAAAALYDRYLVTGDAGFLIDLIDDLVADYRKWEEERQTAGGLFWQYDVRDGMEESISGSRRKKNIRPTINSYMVANARAISEIAKLANRNELQAEFDQKARTLHEKMLLALWDPDAQFFKVRLENGEFSDAREAIGFIPWAFRLADRDHTEAWHQLKDSSGFKAPKGLTTAERRHPQFRSHGVGTCEWDGAVWPFATSQTLSALANVLRGPEQEIIYKHDFFGQLTIYATAHQQNGMPYIGEYHDEITGEWLIKGPKAERSRFYNHSTFNDLIIGGLAGVVPRADDTLEIDPLIPEEAWDWFCLDGVNYHGHSLIIVWDRHGTHYGKGKGLSIIVDGEQIAQSNTIQRTVVELPASE